MCDISDEVRNKLSRKAEANCDDTSTFELFACDSLDSCLENYSLAYIQSQPNKRRKLDHAQQDVRPLVFVRFNASLGKAKPVTIRALLDSGASESLVSQKHVKKLRIKKAGKSSTAWSTPGGDMTTNQKVKAQFSIPELQDKKLIEWDPHVAKDMNNYDMIIGRDLVFFLKIDVLFSNQTIEWDDYSMPFKPADASLVHYHIEESMAAQSGTDRVREILDAKCVPADMEKVCQGQEHLTSDERQQLKALLEKFEDRRNSREVDRRSYQDRIEEGC